MSIHALRIPADDSRPLEVLHSNNLASLAAHLRAADLPNVTYVRPNGEYDGYGVHHNLLAGRENRRASRTFSRPYAGDVIVHGITVDDGVVNVPAWVMAEVAVKAVI